MASIVTYPSMLVILTREQELGRLPIELVTKVEVDRILGGIHEYCDSSFNILLELGFADAIRREWAWRVSRGESLANLEAFKHLV